MAKVLEVEFFGESFWLLPERACVWREENALLLGDLHFGKAEVFQKYGLGVPSGHGSSDLQKIDQLINSYNLKRLFLLGDIFHAPNRLNPKNIEVFRNWHAQASYDVTFVMGNHDKHFLKVFPEMGAETVAEFPHRQIVLRHDFDERDERPQITAHVHPKIRLGMGSDRLLLPCFVESNRELMLPAFGEFTGGFEITDTKDKQIFIVGGDEVFSLPFR